MPTSPTMIPPDDLKRSLKLAQPDNLLHIGLVGDTYTITVRAEGIAGSPSRGCVCAAYDLWLDPGMSDVNAASELLKPYDARLMRCYPTSTRVNHVGNDDEECSAHVELAQIQDRLFPWAQLLPPNPLRIFSTSRQTISPSCTADRSDFGCNGIVQCGERFELVSVARNQLALGMLYSNQRPEASPLISKNQSGRLNGRGLRPSGIVWKCGRGTEISRANPVLAAQAPAVAPRDSMN